MNRFLQVLLVGVLSAGTLHCRRAGTEGADKRGPMADAVPATSSELPKGVSGDAGGGPLFPCIDGWPARPAKVQKAKPGSAKPRILWEGKLPSSAPLSSQMVVTGNGFALSAADALLVYDGDGKLVASVKGTSQISSPVAGLDGSIYFADSTSAYRVDGKGGRVWQKSFGAPDGGPEPMAPAKAALDASGRLYVSAPDGKLWIFRGEDGDIVSSFSLGLFQGRPHGIDLGVGDVLFVDRSRLAATGSQSGALGLLSIRSGTWLGEVTVGNGVDAPFGIAGHDIGVVMSGYVDSGNGAEKTDTFVVSPCGELRFRIPGEHTVPLAITFDDDLIVMDRIPRDGGYDFALRRFSRDGAIVAGPVNVPDAFCGRGFVGADDTFYYTGWASDGYRLRAFDSSLRELWTVPFPYCPEAAVMNGDGKIFAAKGTAAKMAAFQTPSPGPGRVSWGQVTGDARATRWLGP